MGRRRIHPIPLTGTAAKERGRELARAWWLANVGNPQRRPRRPVARRPEFGDQQGGAHARVITGQVPVLGAGLRG